MHVQNRPPPLARLISRTGAALVALLTLAGPVAALEASPTADAAECVPFGSYARLQGIRSLDASERNRIRGRSWYSNGILYLDVYNDNRRLTVTKVAIRIIPRSDGHGPAGEPIQRADLSAVTPCDYFRYYRGHHIYELELALPPKRAQQARIKVYEALPRAGFTWQIVYAEGHKAAWREFRW